jgi:hypothetical protein
VDLTAAHTLTWEVARVGGMVAYVLATASVVLGLLLSLGVRSQRWPRFITNELHRFLSVLTLTFVVIHTAAVFIDPFTAFTPAEVLVPFVAHYRPLWIALGIVSGYLAVAVWASEYVRSRIGYAWWPSPSSRSGRCTALARAPTPGSGGAWRHTGSPSARWSSSSAGGCSGPCHRAGGMRRSVPLSSSRLPR